MFFRRRWGESVIWDTFAFNLFDMKYFCFGWFGFWVVPRNEEHWGTRKVSLGIHSRRWREVGMVCLCCGRQRSKLIEIFFTTGTIPSLLSAADGWMNSTNYALSDKAARNFRKADGACDEWRQNWKSWSPRDFWASPAFDKGTALLRKKSGSSICERAPLRSARSASSISEERLFIFFFL